MNTVAPAASQAQSNSHPQQQPTPPASGSATPQPAPSAAAAGRSFVGAANHTPAKEGSSHTKSTSISPAVPSLGGPAIANGNAAVGSTSSLTNHHHGHSHSRKPSVTISAAGNSGQMPNGGPAVGQTPTGNGIQFGSMNNVQASSQNMAAPQENASLAVNNPAQRNPDPANSPSPVPQPAIPSGGTRPLQSSLHQSTGSLSFGNFASNEDAQRRSSVPSQGPMTPNMQTASVAHSRRESNPHHDVNMASGPGRGGYPPSGRGRGGYNTAFNQQMPHSPSSGFRNPPNGPRGPGGANMGPPYAGRGYGAPYSPSRASPALASAQPVQPQIPMQSPMAQYNYAPYNGAPNVKPSKSSSRNYSTLKGKPGKQSNRDLGRRKRDLSWPNLPAPDIPGSSPALSSSNPMSFHRPQALPLFHAPFVFSPNSLAPSTNNFEYALTRIKQMQPPYDPNYYNAPPYAMQGQMPGMYMAPQNGGYIPPNQNSPRPGFAQQNPGYMGNQYNQPPTASRQDNQASDRPSSTLGQPAQPSITPSHQHNPSRGTGSPVPKSQFPAPKKSAAIKITNPNTGEALKFDKNSSSSNSAASSITPKAPETTATPPPRTPSATHSRSDSTAKTSEQVRNDMRDAVQAKIKADAEAIAQKAREEEEAKKQKEEEEAEAQRKAEEEKKAAEEKALREAEEAKLAAQRALEAEQKKKLEQEAEELKKIEEEKTRAAAAAAKELAAKPKIDDGLPPRPVMPDMDATDEVWAAYEKADAEYEAAVEAAAAKRKAAKKKDEDAKAADKASKLDEELKRQEEEAERIEAEKERKRTDQDSSNLDAFKALRKSGNAFKASETSTEALPDHGSPAGSGANTPKSDTPSMPPPSVRAGQKAKPAALKLETQKQVEAAQPSAALQSLLSARRLTQFDQNVYPSGVMSPNPALNTSAKGSFRYDKDFLLQFQKVFTEKPSENWQEKLKETVGDTNETPGSARGGRPSIGGSRTPSGRPSVPSFSGGGMGNFGGSARTLPPGTSSDQRFAASNQPGTTSRAIRYDPKAGFPGNFPMPLRQNSNTMASPRPGGSKAGGSQRGNASKQGGNKRNDAADAKSMPLTAGKDVKPIEITEGGWKPRSLVQKNVGPPPGGEDGYIAPDVVQRKVKSSLNKMTPTTFEKISGQIIEIVMQSKKETDGRTLRQVIQLTFEKATDEAHWAEMYAQFCGKMLNSMTPEIRDETLPKDKHGQVVSGSTLFRKYLLNRCQQDFEQGWQSKLPKGEGEEAALLSDEYYAAAAAKRRGLGLIRFIGELFKLHMLTARIMHMCVQKLVDFEGMPDEAEVESLTGLLRTIGGELDSDEKGHVFMDVYFGKIDEMIKVKDLPSRLQFMLMDIIDLRKAGWKGKLAANKGPSTIEQVRKEAVEQQQAQELRAAQEQQQRRGAAGGRPGAGRGDGRNFSGPMQPDVNVNRVGMDDLRRLGKGSNRSTGSQGPMGPTSMFNTRGSNKRPAGPGGIFSGKSAEDSAASSRTATPPIRSDKERREEAEKTAAASNAFSALAALNSDESNDMAGSPATSPPTAKRPLPGDMARSGDGA